MNKKISTPIAILIILLCAILVGGIVVWQYYEMPEEEEEEEEPGEFPTDETADWKTYRNEEYEYEIKYPKNWYFRFTTTPESFNITNNEDINNSLSIRTPLEAAGSAFINVPFDEDIFIADNIPAKKKTELGRIVIQWKYKEGGVIIYDYPYKETEETDYLKIFTQMLSTFRFLEKEEPYIEVLSPNGGEEWKIGDTYSVTWEFSGVDKVIIDLVDYRAPESCLLNDGKPISAETGTYTFELTTCIAHPGMGSYLEVQIVAGDKYKLLVQGFQTESGLRDFSDDYFNIVAD